MLCNPIVAAWRRSIDYPPLYVLSNVYEVFYTYSYGCGACLSMACAAVPVVLTALRP